MAGLTIVVSKPMTANDVVSEEAVMLHTMFNDVVDPSVKIGHQHQYAVPLSVAAHTAFALVLIAVPLFTGDVLPVLPAMMTFVALPAAAPLPPPPPPARTASPRTVTEPKTTAAPVEAPSTIASEPQVDNRAILRTVDDLPGTIPSGLVELAPPAPPPADRTEPLRVGGIVQPPTKIKDVKPIYPAIALAARVQGTVIIEATIGPTGKVEDAVVLRSHPLLEAAALAAVRQWAFTPTLLNGVPVSVVMTVTVTFNLQ